MRCKMAAVVNIGLRFIEMGSAAGCDRLMVKFHKRT